MNYLIQPLVSDAANGPGSSDTRIYALTAVHSGLALSVDGTNEAIQKKWTESSNQRWKLIKLANGNFRIENVGSGKVLDVADHNTGNYGNVIQWSWSGGTNQQWRLIDLGSGQYRIEGVEGGKCLDVVSANTGEDAQVQTYSWGGAENQKWLISEVRDTSVMFDAKATVYADANYTGQSKVMGPGKYDISQLGIPNDSLSSVRVPAGLRVTLYQDANFRGNHISFDSDTSFVGSGFNDQTSAILVEKVVKIHQDPNYGGNSQTLGIGRYNLADMSLPNDSLSSIEVPQGLMAILYQDVNFSGRRKVFFENAGSVGSDFENLASSIIVKASGVVIPDQAIQFGSTIALKSSAFFKYVVDEGDGRANCNRTAIGSYEKFTVVRSGDSKHNSFLSYGDVVSLRNNAHNNYLRALIDGGLNADRTAIGAHEQFVIYRAGTTADGSFVSKGDQIALMSLAFHKFIRAVTDGTLNCDRDTPLGHENFTIDFWEAPPASAVGATESNPNCGVQAPGLWNTGSGPSVCGANACGADMCGAAACGAATALFAGCAVATAGVAVCLADFSGVAVVGVGVAGAAICGVAAGGLTACGADACGAAACGVAACGAAACGAAACGADACGAAASAVGLCAANACGADVGGIDACPADACGANVCGINLCPADACGADACGIDLIPIIPFI